MKPTIQSTTFLLSTNNTRRKKTKRRFYYILLILFICTTSIILWTTITTVSEQNQHYINNNSNSHHYFYSKQQFGIITTTFVANTTITNTNREKYSSANDNVRNSNDYDYDNDEYTVFQRLKDRAQLSLDTCFQPTLQNDYNNHTISSTNYSINNHDHDNNTTLLLEMNTNITTMTSIPLFHIHNDLNYYFIQSSKHKESKIQNLRPYSTTNKPSMKCKLPPALKCDADGYSVILTYFPNHHTTNTNINSNQNNNHAINDLRILFMNILYITSFSQSKDIILIYHDNSSILEQNGEYGRRILQWNTDENHPLFVIFTTQNNKNNDNNEYWRWKTTTASSDMEEEEEEMSFHHPLFLFHPTIVDLVKEDVILFMDGSIPIISQGGTVGGESTLRSGFELLRQNSQRLVLGDISILTMMDHHPNSNTHNMYSHRQEEYPKMVNKNSSDDFRYVCPHEHHSNLNLDDRNISSMLQAFSGMFLHRNYICFLWHTNFRPLRNHLVQSVKQEQSEDVHPMNFASIFITVVISQLSGHGPLVYPFMKQSFTNISNYAGSIQKKTTRNIDHVTRMLYESHDASITEINMDFPTTRRRRNVWGKENENYELVKKDISHHIPTRRVLRDDIHIDFNMTNDSNKKSSIGTESERFYIKSILNYFGSYISDYSDWCQTMQNNCISPSIETLPWMQNNKCAL